MLNCLTESTFFYREDERDTFDYLRRHRAELERFFRHYFDWDLHVDRKVARLYRRGQYNRALSGKQRDLFDLTRREECILFMLLLEFHEQQMQAQNLHFEHDEDVRFLFGDFVTHVLGRFRQELGERAPADRELLAHVRTLFRELERHRFLRLVEKGPPAASDRLPDGQLEQELWVFLPGIRCYDPGRLNEVIARAYGGTTASAGPEAPPAPEGPAVERRDDAGEGEHP